MTEVSKVPDLVLEVMDIARGGAGVAREPSGRVVFIPKSAPGDLVRVRIIEENKKYAQGELLEVLRPSPVRQAARCPVFGTCGGCAWQHLPYELQWKTKVSGVRHAMSRVQLAEPPNPVEEFPAEKIWEYRNRIQLRGEGDRIGFHAPGSRNLVAVDRCDIARPELNDAWESLREEGAHLSARLRKPYKVEVAVQEDGTLRKVWNAKHGAAGFRQVHDDQNEKLRAWVASRLTSGRVLYDLFGGSGNLSLALAGRMAEVHCVDLWVPREAPNGTPSQFRFHRGDVARWLATAAPTAVLNKKGEASAILDPPREGLADRFNEIEAALTRLGVRELIAVGCDPDAWVRDVSRFVRHSWRLERIAFFDFFPQTPHIESVALLMR